MKQALDLHAYPFDTQKLLLHVRYKPDWDMALFAMTQEHAGYNSTFAVDSIKKNLEEYDVDENSSHITVTCRPGTCAWPYNRPCAQQYVGKSQSCMVINGDVSARQGAGATGAICGHLTQTTASVLPLELFPAPWDDRHARRRGLGGSGTRPLHPRAAHLDAGTICSGNDEEAFDLN